MQALRAKEFNQDALEGLVAVGSTKLQHVPAFAAQHGIAAAPEFFHGEKFFGGPRGDECNRIGRNFRHQTREVFVGALVGENGFPAHAAAIAVRARRRSELFCRSATDVCAAADVSLNHAFRFQLGVCVRDGCTVNTQLGGELAAGRDAVAGAEFAGMDEGAELIAQLDVKGYVAFGL